MESVERCGDIRRGGFHTIDPVALARGNGEDDPGLRHFILAGALLLLRSTAFQHVEIAKPGEGGGKHEIHQQQEHDIDQRRQRQRLSYRCGLFNTHGPAPCCAHP